MSTSQKQVLESVAVKGHLQGLCLELEVVQTFVNSSKHNIEAIYTFPLPYEAVLLDLTVKLGEKVLTGSVIAKKQAEADYEDAITDGNSAIMLERADDGICTINVGNLLAGECAEVRYRFSQLLSWQQDSLRITLPTAMAPRYGDPIAAGWQPHQITPHSLLDEYPFSLALDIAHPLSSAMIECPSHTVTITHESAVTHVTLGNKQAWLDRDFILNLTLENSDKDAGQYAPDGDQYVALASFSPNILTSQIGSVCIKVVIDCSGSMAGDSIKQAKIGMLRILDHLRDEDAFNIVQFGSVAEACFPSCVPATKVFLDKARRYVAIMEADLGGTEMADALKFAYALKEEGDRPASILLITDGDITQHEHIVRQAKYSEHRIFTVGVGSSVAEAFVKNIATSTGGAAELVSPNEEMAATILRQFNRINQPRATSAKILWPNKKMWQSPALISNVFAGDTLHVFAAFTEPPIGDVCLQLILEDGQTLDQKVQLQAQEIQSELGRIAAASRIEKMDDNSELQATVMAVEYQVISKYTNYLIIEERSDKHMAAGLPIVTQVPHMLAAGHGGTGSVGGTHGVVQYNIGMQIGNSVIKQSAGYEQYDIPAFLRKQADESYFHDLEDDISPTINLPVVTVVQDSVIPQHVNTVMSAVFAVVKAASWYKAYLENIRPKLPNELISVLDSLVIKDGLSKETVAAALILAMLSKLENIIPRHEKRVLLVALKAENPPPTLENYFEAGLILGGQVWVWNAEGKSWDQTV